MAIIRPYEYKFDLPRVMSFNLVSHLQRLVGWERRTTASDAHVDRLTLRKFMDIFTYILYIFNFCHNLLHLMEIIGMKNCVEIIIDRLQSYIYQFPNDG